MGHRERARTHSSPHAHVCTHTLVCVRARVAGWSGGCRQACGRERGEAGRWVGKDRGSSSNLQRVFLSKKKLSVNIYWQEGGWARTEARREEGLGFRV